MPGEQEGKSRPGRVPPPKCVAFLLCEKTIIEQATRRVTLINVFNNVAVGSFPGSIPEFKVFLRFSGGIGRQRLRVEIQDLEEDLILDESLEILLNWGNRLASSSAIVPFDGVQVSHAGAYDVVVFIDGDEIERQRLSVTALEEQEGGSGK